MIVGTQQLEAALACVAARVSDPRAGIHGPGSTAWRLHRESLVFLGGGRAALLQLAHPYVAHAVDQHSATRRDALGRFRRTFLNVFAMTFGDLDQALTAARRVHRVHCRITGVITEDVGPFTRGHRYHANDLDALRWVWATLIHTVVQVVGEVCGPLPHETREQYYRDSKVFAALFGLGEAHVPRDWAAFDAYFTAMVASPVITVGEPARDIGRFLFAAPGAGEPAAAWARIMTAGLLPGRVRRQYQLPFGRRERAVYRTSLAALARGYPRLPERVRLLPAYLAAEARLGIARRRNPIEQAARYLALRRRARRRARRARRRARRARVSA